MRERETVHCGGRPIREPDGVGPVVAEAEAEDGEDAMSIELGVVVADDEEAAAAAADDESRE